MTATDESVVLQFSVDELGALAAMMGAERFPGVPDDAFQGVPVGARDAAATAARRGLVARGLVVFAPEGTAALDPVCAQLVTISLSAELVVAAERRDRTQTLVRHYYVEPEVGVQHDVAFGSIHRLSRFPTAELLERVVEFTGLEGRDQSPGKGFTTDAATFELLRRGMSSGDLSDAREALGPDGEGFADAIDRFVGSARAQVLRRLVSGGVEGGEVVWVDAGDALWAIEPEPIDRDGSAGDQRVAIEPTTAGAIVERLLGFLIPATP